MANKATAQEKLNNGSFVLSKVSSGSLDKNKMYRIKNVTSEGKYVVLDTGFCGTNALKGKKIAFDDRFTIISEDAVKDKVKELLESRGFTKDGQKFIDVRSSQEVTVESSSRTHILIKFGRIMGIKIAGGHVWFAGYPWAKPLVDVETMPDSPADTKPTQIPEEYPNSFTVHIPTKRDAIHFVNMIGCDVSGSFEENWDIYEHQTVFIVKNGKVRTYANINFCEEKNVPFISFNEWKKLLSSENESQSETPKTKRSLMKGTGTIEEQILAVVDEHLTSEDARKKMEDSVESLLNKWGIDKNVRQLEVKVNDKPVVKVGKVHYKYDLVLKCMMARTNVALVGPAGSGKTTTVAKAAEALELKFYSKSVSAQTGAHEFFGYQDANGNYVRTLFRDAYEHGGVFLLDEFDAGNPNVLAALNQATANEHCAFADGMVSKHENFICVMAGNTYGHGANSEYVGRNKIDAATLDRFAFIDFPYDEDLEYALADNKPWCKKVQAFRKKVVEKKIKTVVSPRATIIGCQLLRNGVSESEVMELVIYKGLNKEERNLLS